MHISAKTPIRYASDRFATFYKGDTAVYAAWFSRTGSLRVIAEPKGTLPPLTDTTEGAFDTLLTGMKGETVIAAEGMGYIIRLCDGSFLIIDGGIADGYRHDCVTHWLSVGVGQSQVACSFGVWFIDVPIGRAL